MVEVIICWCKMKMKYFMKTLWQKHTIPTYTIFLILKDIRNRTNLSCTYLKTIIGYLQLKSSTNLVWNYCSIQFVLPWNVQYFWVMNVLGNQKTNQLQGLTSTLVSTAWSILFVAIANFLNAWSWTWVQSFGSTSLIYNSIISNLTLCTVLNH